MCIYVYMQIYFIRFCIIGVVACSFSSVGFLTQSWFLRMPWIRGSPQTECQTERPPRRFSEHVGEDMTLAMVLASGDEGTTSEDLSTRRGASLKADPCILCPLLSALMTGASQFRSKQPTHRSKGPSPNPADETQGWIRYDRSCLADYCNRFGIL